MANEKILIIEDDPDIRELVRYNLVREGYRVTEASGGKSGLERAMSESWDIILLDLMLPEINGLEICRAIKRDADASQTPIIMVTAKGSEADVVTGLEMGADDYLVKPFSPKILVARVKAVLRRGGDLPVEKEGLIKAGDIEIHVGRHEVQAGGNPVTLTLTEFQILHLLVSRPGWVFTRYQIVDHVKGGDYPVTDRAIDVQIVGLRKKLGAHGSSIQTVRGIGYRFAGPSHVGDEEE